MLKGRASYCRSKYTSNVIIAKYSCFSVSCKRYNITVVGPQAMNRHVDGSYTIISYTVMFLSFNFGRIAKFMQFSYLDWEYEALLQLPIITSTQVTVAIKYVFLTFLSFHLNNRRVMKYLLQRKPISRKWKI